MPECKDEDLLETPFADNPPTCPAMDSSTGDKEFGSLLITMTTVVYTGNLKQ
jgi:hypothetical protein